MDPITTDLKKYIKGEVSVSEETLSKFSHDASIFEVRPSCVISPLDQSDVENAVKYVNLNKNKNPKLSITARSAGTDMGGGSLTESIILSFTDHMNKILSISDSSAVIEPGLYYRDFEKISLEKSVIFPAYPASREICAFGGMISDNCGGEKSLEYGKAERYVKRLKMVLSDGNTYDFGELNEGELKLKMELNTFEGEIYRKIFKLISENKKTIADAKPKVSKNSAGYAIWNVYDTETKKFDMTKLFVGAQGTLGVFVEAEIKLVPIKKYTEMLVVYMYDQDMEKLGKIINTVLESKPESFETYDDNTLKLALKYFSEFQKKLGTTNIISTAIKFIPEFILSFQGKIPKLVLQIEFGGDDKALLKNKISILENNLKEYKLVTKAVGDETQSKKYWLIRRESFRLLKEKIKDKYASPFIDDIVVNPEYLTEFLPRFNNLLKKYPSIIATTAGHIGDGNFHVIPLVNIREPSEQKIIQNLGREVYDLVNEYHGTTNGEHNDGLIRTPYLKNMYGEEVFNLFVDIKKIFDPNNIFNPGKKIDVTMEYSMSHIRQSW